MTLFASFEWGSRLAVAPGGDWLGCKSIGPMGYVKQ
jgi:hypothetical protein